MQEDRPDLPFASVEPGRMHACGHDGHAATVMAACAWIDDHLDELTGEIHAIFQHAEETAARGRPGDGGHRVLRGFDFIYGFHYFATVPTGTIDVKDGPASANSDLFRITVTGRGGHASMPADTLDPVWRPQLVGHAADGRVPAGGGGRPDVVSTTWLEAGTLVARNVIPGSARLGGSVRTTDQETRDLVQRPCGSSWPDRAAKPG